VVVIFVVTAACGGGAKRTATSRRVTTTSLVTASTQVTTTTSRGANSTTTTSSASAASAPVSVSCDVAAQGPPRASIPADFATALAFAPDGRLFFAERSGTVRVYERGASRVFATVATVTTEPGGGYSERGLLGLAVSPTFAQDRFVYALYSSTDRAHQTIVRWKDCGGVGTSPTALVTLPAGSDCCHKGGRLAFGPDGKLYVTLGEEHTAPAAQNTSDVRGKVLRYNPDGTVPADNPFGPTDPVWAFGFRNPFGIAFSATGQLAVTNNGPTGDAGSPSTGYDTVVVSVARGSGHQWPYCYGYSHPISGSASCGSGQSGPDWSSEGATVVPTGAAYIDGAGPPPYANHLVLCTSNAGMQILTPGSPHATVTQGPSSCRLDVKEGPDHALYVSDTSQIVRLG
jgi:glucose/arabinose dehydrogenase